MTVTLTEENRAKRRAVTRPPVEVRFKLMHVYVHDIGLYACIALIGRAATHGDREIKQGKNMSIHAQKQGRGRGEV